MRWSVVAAIVMTAGVAHAAVEDDLRDGDRLFEGQEWARAAAAYDRAIAKAPGQVPAEAYGKRAAIFIILRDYTGGLAFVEDKAKARYPKAPEVLEQEALLLWETGKKESAIAVAEVVVAAKPTAFTNQKLIGEWYATRDAAKTATAYTAYLAARPAELEAGDVLPRIRLGFAQLANARTAIAGGDDAGAQKLFAAAAEQFETLQRKHAKRPNALVNAQNGLCAAYTGMERFDQAVTVCEKVAASTKTIDATGSAWFNLGTAYLARKQIAKARGAATEFTRMRKGESRGYVLLGDTYFAESAWEQALDEYQHAEQLAKPGQSHDAVELSIRLGKTYRRLPHPNVELAVQKLASGMAANPDSAELALELGAAYLETKQDAKAVALADRMLAQASPTVDERAGLLVIAGKGQYNQTNLAEARSRFEQAQQLKPADVTIKRALVLAINEQAYEAGDDGKRAEALLGQALTVDPDSPVTLTNVAILAIGRGDCDGARTTLGKLETLRGADALVSARLHARSYLCGTKPDPAAAAKYFETAEKEAKKAGATLVLAEIYTEWAPLIVETDVNDAVDKLEIAVETGAKDASISAAARRNLALALYRRGWKLMRDGKAGEAATDFDRALKDTSVLQGTEPPALQLSRAIAALDVGKSSEAAKLFDALAKAGNQSAYIKAPYAKVGAAFFSAYASYRVGSVSALQSAVGKLEKLSNEGGAFGDKVNHVLAAAYEAIAIEQWRAGRGSATTKALDAAEKKGDADVKRRVGMDRTVMVLDKGDLSALEALNGNPAESLVNAGILYDQLGRPRDAYDAWTKAKAKGVAHKELAKWIDAKKRIYGY